MSVGVGVACVRVCAWSRSSYHGVGARDLEERLEQILVGPRVEQYVRPDNHVVNGAWQPPCHRIVAPQ